MTSYLLANLRLDHPEFNIKQIFGPRPGFEKIALSESVSLFNTSDMVLSSTYDNPCVVPSNGVNYSFVKSFVVYLGTDKINNKKIKTIKWYPTELNEPYGIKVLVNEYPFLTSCRCKEFGVMREGYKQATGIIGVTGDPMKYAKEASKFDYDNPLNLGFDKDRLSSNILQLQIKINTFAAYGYLNDVVKSSWIVETE